MKPNSPKSGLEELMQLSQQFKKQEQSRVQKENERAKQRQKVQSVLGGLRDVKIATAVSQLKRVASPRLVGQVESLKRKQGNEDLRRMISLLADNLEKHVGGMTAKNPDMKPVEQSMKTLTILIELFFSLS
jgi:signal transduction histidine kinase